MEDRDDDCLPSMLRPGAPGTHLSRAQTMQAFVYYLDRLAVRHHRDSQEIMHQRLRTDYLDYLGRYVLRRFFFFFFFFFPHAQSFFSTHTPSQCTFQHGKRRYCTDASAAV
jgi:hypothetical protein